MEPPSPLDPPSPAEPPPPEAAAEVVVALEVVTDDPVVEPSSLVSCASLSPHAARHKRSATSIRGVAIAFVLKTPRFYHRGRATRAIARRAIPPRRLLRS